MVSTQTEQNLIKLLHSICENERKLEFRRHMLCDCATFSPLSCFHYLTDSDETTEQYLTASSLYQFFQTHGIPQPYSHVQQLIKNINKSRDSKMNYDDFLDFILPKQNDQLKELAMQRNEASNSSSREKRKLESDVELGIVRLLQQVISNAISYDGLRQELRTDYNFATQNCFDLLKDPLLPVITMNSLDQFMRLHNIIIPENELQAGIMYADVDGDGNLSYNEFIDLLIVGMPAPVQTSPKKARLSPSRNNGTQEAVQMIKSPQKQTFSQFTPSKQPQSYQFTPNKYKFTPSRILASPYRSQQLVQVSPGGQKVTEKHQEEQLQKIDDNLKYSEYIQKGRESSAKKRASPQQQQEYQSPSRNRSYKQQQEYQSPSRNRSYISPRKQQVSEQEKEQLMNLLRNMIKQDRELQALKQQLTQQQDFNLLDAFHLLDIGQSANISKIEFEKGINQLNVYPSSDQIYLFFKVFDQNKDGLLQYGDFASVFYTPDSEQVNLLKSRAPAFVDPLQGECDRDIFSQTTRTLLKRFLTQVFETETALDSLREQLQLRPMFNLYEAFTSLDLDQDGIVSYEELKIMLHNYGIITSENEMISLFSRFDKDKDGRIKYQEFIEEVVPKSPSRYKKY